MNKRDISPRRTSAFEQREQHPTEGQSIAAPTLAKATISSADLSSTVATDVYREANFGRLPTFSFAPERGALYHRRATKLQSNTQLPPTPPSSSKADFPPAKRQRTRTRSVDTPPPHELDFSSSTFCIYKALLGHPELIFEVAKHLTVPSLVSLYAISRDFHHLANARFTALILGNALTHAPESSRIFRFKCYGNLCQHDPARKPSAIHENEVRGVPSFRWLNMIRNRERIVDEIVNNLAREGHRLPRKTTAAIKKIWFMMDIGDNSRRVGLIHNREFWTDRDLFLGTLFLIKLDMRLTDAVDGNGETGLRKLMLSQRSLTYMHGVLNRTVLKTQYELMQAFVEWKYVPAPPERGLEIMGVPWHLVGRGQLEGWGRGRKLLIRPDELIMREAARRKLGFEKQYLDMMIWGHIDQKTKKDIWPLQEEGSRRSVVRDGSESGSWAGCGDSDDDEIDEEEIEEDEEVLEEVDWIAEEGAGGQKDQADDDNTANILQE